MRYKIEVWEVLLTVNLYGLCKVTTDLLNRLSATVINEKDSHERAEKLSEMRNRSKETKGEKGNNVFRII